MISNPISALRRFATPLDTAFAAPLLGMAALLGLGLGATLTIQAPGPALRAAPAELPLSSRVPRPRPDEPVMTASLGPSRKGASQAGAIRKVSVRPVEAEGLGVEILRSKAFLLASSSPDCDRVVSSEAFESRDSPSEIVVFRVRCENGARFHLGREELEADRVPQPSRIESARSAPPAAARASVSPGPALSDLDVVRACEEQVRNGLAVPRSLSRLSPSTDVHQNLGGAALVTFDFDALNGFGFPMAMRAQCVFDEREIADLKVQPR